MFRRYRQRRGPYALAAPNPVPSFVKSGIFLLIVALVLFFVGRGILHLFGISVSEARTPVTLSVESHSAVDVSLEGGAMQRADDSLKLYAGDKVSVGTNAHARLAFFDGTWVRTDAATDLSIQSSTDATGKAAIAIALSKGSIVVRTPRLDAFSGSVTRTVSFPTFSVVLNSDTQAFIDGGTLIVFSADGDGVSIKMNGKKPVFIGEGQELQIPAAPTDDLLTHRSAIDPLAIQQSFVRESRALISTSQSTTQHSSGAALDLNALIITSPSEGTVVASDTIKVMGKIGAKAASVRVNGYLATIDRTQNTFAEELAFNDSAKLTIQIQAMDENGIVLNEVTRSVSRTVSQVPVPTITSPAGNGRTYRTQATQIEIKGTAPASAAGLMVNDYKLQLFRPGDTTWSYLASSALNNLLPGSNVFNVYALDASGRQSAPAVLTVLVEQGTEGIVQTGSTVVQPEQADEKTLPQNAPLTPGVIAVTGPLAGSSFTATGSEILLEGTTSPQTDSIWINGYKLRLFKAGKTTWNYIASAAYTTLKKGTNVYHIHARNKDNQLLDSFDYTVKY